MVKDMAEEMENMMGDKIEAIKVMVTATYSIEATTVRIEITSIILLNISSISQIHLAS